MYEVARASGLGPALATLVRGIDDDVAGARADTPHAVRRRVQHALTSPQLLLDCAHLLLSQLAFEPSCQHLYLDPSSRYYLQLFSWPGRFSNEPHRHDDWNVSAVFTGSLEIFRSDRSAADCSTAPPLSAATGDVGVLIPPQFHFLHNTADTTALTFHVFSCSPARDRVPHREGPADTGAGRLDADGVLALATLAAASAGSRARDVIRVAFVGADNTTRLALVKLMATIDVDAGVEMGKHLARLVGGEDGDRLLAVLDRMAVAG